MNVAWSLRTAARAFRDAPALALGAERRRTYAEFDTRAQAIAHDLAERGLVPGDRVAIVMANAVAYLELLYGAWYAGLVAVPVNAKLHPREVAYIVEHAGARLVVTDATHAAGLAGTLAYVLADDIAAGARCAEREPLDVPPEAPAWLFYTSGTTGRPKGATLSHRALTAMTLNYFADIEPVEPGNAMFHPGALSHGAGLYALPFVAKAGVNVIMPHGGFDPAELCALVPHYARVSMFAVPTMVTRLEAYARTHRPQLRTLATIVYGGGPMYLADILRARETFGNVFVQLYGQGESPMTISGLSRAMHDDTAHARYHERLASVGIARVGSEVRVVDEDGMRVADGTVGEVVTRGDVVMNGYWNDPAATAHALRDGWLFTGDLGSFDADGFLTLRDRSKDLIISGGSNVYPREVEEVLLRHPAVAEVSVVGRAHADLGEEIVAFVVTRDGAAVSDAELDALCLGELARFKRPRAYLRLDELPKNAYGKVLKTALRETPVDG